MASRVTPVVHIRSRLRLCARGMMEIATYANQCGFVR